MSKQQTWNSKELFRTQAFLFLVSEVEVEVEVAVEALTIFHPKMNGCEVIGEIGNNKSEEKHNKNFS